MDAARTSFELLAHFEKPAATEDSPTQLRPTVGAVCVLKWAAGAGVLFFATCALLQLRYCIAAELTLSHAARAGVVEATLPRATLKTIVETIERRLQSHSIPPGMLQIAIQQNDVPMQRVLRLADGYRVSLAISLPIDAVLPAWLRVVNVWTGNASIECVPSDVCRDAP